MTPAAKLVMVFQPKNVAIAAKLVKAVMMMIRTISTTNSLAKAGGSDFHKVKATTTTATKNNSVYHAFEAAQSKIVKWLIANGFIELAIGHHILMVNSLFLNCGLVRILKVFFS